MISMSNHCILKLNLGSDLPDALMDRFGPWTTWPSNFEGQGSASVASKQSRQCYNKNKNLIFSFYHILSLTADTNTDLS